MFDIAKVLSNSHLMRSSICLFPTYKNVVNISSSVIEYTIVYLPSKVYIPGSDILIALIGICPFALTDSIISYGNPLYISLNFVSNMVGKTLSEDAGNGFLSSSVNVVLKLTTFVFSSDTKEVSLITLSS